MHSAHEQVAWSGSAAVKRTPAAVQWATVDGRCVCVLGPVTPPSTASFYLSRLIFGADRHGARFPHQLKNELTREPHAIGAWTGSSPGDGLPVVTASSSLTYPSFSVHWQLTYSPLLANRDSDVTIKYCIATVNGQWIDRMFEVTHSNLRGIITNAIYIFTIKWNSFNKLILKGKVRKEKVVLWKRHNSTGMVFMKLFTFC